MTEKRKYTRYVCKIKTVFDYYEGDPDNIDINNIQPEKGKGYILDASAGGLFIITNSRVQINMPIKTFFSSKKTKYITTGTIVRTGLLTNNPTEIAQKFSIFSSKGDAYIAIKFDDAIEEFSDIEL